MKDIRKQIATQLNAYRDVEALKAAVWYWVNASDGSLVALEKTLEEHFSGDDDLSEREVEQLRQQRLYFDAPDEETREEDMRRLEQYRQTGYAVPQESVAAWLDSIGTDDELPCPS